MTDINQLHDVIECRVSGRRCGRTTAACHLVAGALETGSRSVAFVVPMWSHVPWVRERLLDVLREHEIRVLYVTERKVGVEGPAVVEFVSKAHPGVPLVEITADSVVEDPL